MGLFENLKKMLSTEEKIKEKKEPEHKIHHEELGNKFDNNYYAQEYHEPVVKTSQQLEMEALGKKIAMNNFQNGGMNQSQGGFQPRYKNTNFQKQPNFPKANPSTFHGDFKPEYEKKKSFKKNEDRCYGLFAKDGDTFVGMYKDKPTTFRLAGINTPEKGQFNYDKAKFFLKDLICKKNIYLTVKGTDVYNRQIVEAYLDEDKTQSINQIILKEGLAKSERYSNNQGELTHTDTEFAANELLEKKAQLGMKS